MEIIDILVKPKKLQGKIEAICSKSYAHRIIMASALCEEETIIHINQFSEDINTTINAIKAFGAIILYEDGGIRVIPNEAPLKLEVFANESGTTGRLILPIMTAVSIEGTLTGAGSLLNRPFLDLCESIHEHGVTFSSDKLPISYHGEMRCGDYKIEGNKSSQYISGLMFALPLLNGDSKIVLTSPLESEGYVNITRDVLNQFGIQSGYEIKGNQKFKSPKEITVEGDWSNSSYWITAGVEVTGLNPNSLQKDRLFLEVKDSEEIDMSDIPDLAPALAVYATQKDKPTKLYNIRRLRIKESDRVQSVKDMIESLGGKVEVFEDHMIIHPSSLTGGTVNSYNDHRIVMSAAVAAQYCSGDVTIVDAHAVNKSYPNFFRDLEKLGGESYEL